MRSTERSSTPWMKLVAGALALTGLICAVIFFATGTSTSSWLFGGAMASFAASATARMAVNRQSH